MMKHLLFPQSVLAAGLLMGGISLAQAETLACDLYVSDSSNLKHEVNVPIASVVLGAERYVGTCHVDGGRIADKQFVVIRQIIGDGSTGKVRGYSIYTLNDKDSLTLEFEGGWGSEGFNGDYTLLSGTGVYGEAKGAGNFKSVANDLPYTSIYAVEIELEYI